MNKIKAFGTTSRGGRRQVLIKNRQVRVACERVARETGAPLQSVFDELIEMFVEGHVFGINTQDKLFERIVEGLENVE